MDKNVKIRFAKEADTKDIHGLICALARYEHLESAVEDNGDAIRNTLFKECVGKCLLAEVNNEVVGMALYFYNISTFKGRKGIYLEDLFVKPEYRGLGIGKSFLRKLASIAKEENCGRVEWSCLDWNQPSIAFYKSIGAKTMDEWTVYRIDEKDFDTFLEK